MKRFFEARKRGVGVDEYAIEVMIGDGHRALVVFLLIAPATYENVSEATNYERARRRRFICFFKHGQQFIRKLLTTEGEQFDEHYARAQRMKRLKNDLPSEPASAINRKSAVAANKPSVRIKPQRREVYHLNPCGQIDPFRQRAAVQEDNSESLGEPGGQSHGTDEMAHAQRVLAVEQDRGLRAHFKPLRLALRMNVVIITSLFPVCPEAELDGELNRPRLKRSVRPSEQRRRQLVNNVREVIAI